jgi:hypothetical protein
MGLKMLGRLTWWWPPPALCLGKESPCLILHDTGIVTQAYPALLQSEPDLHGETWVLRSFLGVILNFQGCLLSDFTYNFFKSLAICIEIVFALELSDKIGLENTSQASYFLGHQ